jgi:(1->4)-alpha-D-glucan 1-alpha-D-glucosylmutase
LVFPLHSCYRVQMRQGIDFVTLTKALDYFKRLGVSHLYLSPIFKASQQSTHGYDVANPNQICPSLGGYHGFVAFANEAKAKGLGIILDIVPNHMVADSKANLWWHDVLESGPHSPYAKFFALRHEQRATGLPAQYILPVLNDRFQNVLSMRALKLELTKQTFYFCYMHYRFPINLLGVELILERAKQAVSTRASLSVINSAYLFVARFNQDFYQASSSELGYLYKKISQQFKSTYLPKVLNACHWRDFFEGLYGDESFLRKLMRLQFYQLVYWRHANRFLNYRRFFNINDLVAMRVEDPSVFEKTHALVIDLCKQGTIDGLRIDHIDGLRYPYEYLNTLRNLLPRHYIFVEKILDANEPLLSDWPIDGSTGYDFLAAVDQLFVDGSSREAMEHSYFNFIGESIDYKQLKVTIKNHVLNSEFYADFTAVVRLFLSVLGLYGEQFDYTQAEISHFLMNVFVHMDVYRTYSDGKGASHRHFLLYWKKNLFEVYKSLQPDYHLLYQRFSSIILNENKSAQERIFVERIQLLLPPLAAKGIEDTLFYRYYRLNGLNEVGGFPDVYGQTPQGFYHFLSRRQKQFKASFSSTTTHDTKTSEDVRSRLIALSQLPEVWIDVLQGYEKSMQSSKTRFNVDRNTCYGLLQYALGCYPIDVDRFKLFAIKMVREADIYSNWIEANEGYEKEILGFVEWMFGNKAMSEVLASACDLILKRANYISLAKVILKYTAPGTPEIYQGNEVLNYKLVDPDNRIPVSFKGLEESLEDVLTKDLGVLVKVHQISLVKLWLHQKCLFCRNEYFDVFKFGRFKDSAINTNTSLELIAYLRGGDLFVCMPRFFELWHGQIDDEALIDIPRPKSSGLWYDAINGIVIKPGRQKLKDLWPILPFTMGFYRPFQDANRRL